MGDLIKNKRIVLKIGSSSLTSAQGEMSHRKLERVVNEVISLKDAGFEVLLVSSGAIAAGYRKLGCLTRPTTLAEEQAAASIGQVELIRTYADLLLEHGYVGSQILLTKSDFSNQGRSLNARNTINVLLERGIIPIINENDTVSMTSLRFGDNDTLGAEVSCLVTADFYMILSDVDGLFRGNPRTDPAATLVHEVFGITAEIEALAGVGGSNRGTGGMKSKIEAFKQTLDHGILSFLGGASVSGIAIQALAQKAKGTYFYPENLRTQEDAKEVAFYMQPK